MGWALENSTSSPGNGARFLTENHCSPAWVPRAQRLGCLLSIVGRRHPTALQANDHGSRSVPPRRLQPVKASRRHQVISVKYGRTGPLGESGLQPHELGQYRWDPVSRFRNHRGRRQLCLADGLPVFARTGQIDTLYIQVAVCECPCGKMSVQKGRNLDPKSLTHLLRGTKVWPLPHPK